MKTAPKTPEPERWHRERFSDQVFEAFKRPDRTDPESKKVATREYVLYPTRMACTDRGLVVGAGLWMMIKKIAELNGFRFGQDSLWTPVSARSLARCLDESGFTFKDPKDRKTLEAVVALAAEGRGLRLETRSVHQARASGG